MLSCKDVQDIIIKEGTLSFSQKISLKFHLIVCKKCRQITTQYQLIKSRIRGFKPLLDEKDHSSIDKIIQSAKIKNK